MITNEELKIIIRQNNTPKWKKRLNILKMVIKKDAQDLINEVQNV
jgi:hypothetical protein